jgi:hypothetical protein
MMKNKNIKVLSIDALVFVYEWLKMCWILEHAAFRPLHFMHS